MKDLRGTPSAPTLPDRPPSVHDISIDAAQSHPLPALYPAAFDNFQQVVAVRPDDRVLLLIDRTMDPRVVSFLWEFARGRGATVNAIMAERAGDAHFAESCKPMIEEATLVLTTWFTSSVHPYFLKLRSERGQRYVKLTYFRSLDLMKTEVASFPLSVMSMLVRKTAHAFPSEGGATVHVTDPRGTDLTITLKQEEIDSLMTQSRWRGEMTAERPGAYVHWVPSHGPNFWDFSASPGGFEGIEGVIAARDSVGFPRPFPDGVHIHMARNRVTHVDGPANGQTHILRDMLIGGDLIEIGCGFNPKHPRNQIYPAGSNSAGALHLGLNLPHNSDFLSGQMPDWPEPPEHLDMVLLDATVTINGAAVVEDGVLCATRDPDIRAEAARYGDAAYLLDVWPMV